MTKKYIIGNWKMNGTRAQAEALAQAAAAFASQLPAGIVMVLCPPAVYVTEVATHTAVSRVALGGQDCHGQSSGAYTGDISAEMLNDTGASYVIVGHSERRQQHGETNELVAQKAAAGLRAGLTPIICVGESASDRSGGKAEKIVVKQVLASIPPAGHGTRQHLLLAYEPVWAIGSGATPSVAEIRTMHQAIKSAVQAAGLLNTYADIAVVYGGSVNAANAKEILAIPEVDGVLVGGASLDAKAFEAIALAAAISLTTNN